VLTDKKLINKTLLIKQQINMYKTAVYTLVNCDIQGLTHQKQQKSYKGDIIQ